MDDLDLDEIARFMNESPEENEISEVDKQDIETTIDFLDTQIAEVKKQSKEISTPEEINQQEKTIDDLTVFALEKMGKIDGNTDKIFELFYDNLSIGKDRSDASKSALVESQRIKVEMISALAQLANAKAKLEMAKQKNMAGATGIYVNTASGNDVGISLHNLWQETK